MTTSGTVVVDQVERGPVGELGVGLVDDDEPGRDVEQQLARIAGRLDQPGRVVRRAQEHDAPAGRLDDHARDLGEVEREVGGPLALDDGRPR